MAFGSRRRARRSRVVGNRTAGSGDSPGMEHDRLVDLVSAWVDGEVDDAERTVVDAHLRSCAPCRRFVADAEALRRQVRVGRVDDGPDPAPVLAALRAVDRSMPASAAPGRDTGHRLARRWVGAAAAVLVAVGVVAAVGRSTGDPTDAEREAAVERVRTGDHSFDHDQVAVPVGGTVEWTNVGSTRHLLVQDGGATTVRTPLAPGDEQDVTFHEEGEYEVRCEIHVDMAATVTVES